MMKNRYEAKIYIYIYICLGNNLDYCRGASLGSFKISMREIELY